MNNIYIAHGGREVVVGGKVTFTGSATMQGGIVPYVADSEATTIAGLRADYNALLRALRESGVMKIQPEAEEEQDDGE